MPLINHATRARSQFDCADDDSAVLFFQTLAGDDNTEIRDIGAALVAGADRRRNANE